MILNNKNEKPNKYKINDFFREKSYKIFQRKYYTKFIYLNIIFIYFILYILIINNS